MYKSKVRIRYLKANKKQVWYEVFQGYKARSKVGLIYLELETQEVSYN